MTSYDDIAARRYAAAESRPDSFSLRLAPRLIRLFHRERPRPTGPGPAVPSLLDIGAGTGQLGDALRVAGFDNLSVDRSLPMLIHRSGIRSGRPGSAVVADAGALPLTARFDLITATFNVVNHLPSLDTVQAMISEVGRLLAPNGLFVFDINTRLGLQATSELTQHHDGPSDLTTWSRHWLDDKRLRLQASGAFLAEGRWHRYEETIDKIVVTVAELERYCTAAGLTVPSWRSDDLETVLDDPEEHPVAFGVVGPVGAQ